MIVGDVKKVNLSTSSFERMIDGGSLYVDKTRFIERFLDESSDVQLVTRQRRLGKSLNMDMLRRFLTDKEDFRHLFSGLYIEKSPKWEQVNSAPVFYFDFKLLHSENYDKRFYHMVCDYIRSYCADKDLSGAVRAYLDDGDYRDSDGLLYLTESVYKATGKRSYILIDEYDKLLMDNYSTDRYDEIRKFETALLSAGLKGNEYLEKALLTGVMRVSRESLFSGLNNIKDYDVFDDQIYTDDFGLTDKEAAELSVLAGFDLDTAREWYNGIRIGDKPIYNTYSVMSYIDSGKLRCYWGMSGTMDMIQGMLNDSRRAKIVRLLNGERVEAEIENRVSLKQLTDGGADDAFYSLLVQGGYLAIDESVPNRGIAILTIPNIELQIVWKSFILKTLYKEPDSIRTLFDNAHNLTEFAKDIEYFINDRLSYHDLAVYDGEDKRKTHERLYHIFMLGILSAYEDVRCQHPKSNRESGDGRYDIFVEKPESNYIFEFKACEPDDDFDKVAQTALKQIDVKRYGMDAGTDKRLVKIGIAFCGKRCKVAVRG